jgi:hypothetical protein
VPNRLFRRIDYRIFRILFFNSAQIMLSPAFPEIISPLFPRRTNLFRHFAEKINIDTGSDGGMIRDGGTIFQM